MFFQQLKYSERLYLRTDSEHYEVIIVLEQLKIINNISMCTCLIVKHGHSRIKKITNYVICSDFYFSKCILLNKRLLMIYVTSSIFFFHYIFLIRIWFKSINKWINLVIQYNWKTNASRTPNSCINCLTCQFTNKANTKIATTKVN